MVASRDNQEAIFVEVGPNRRVGDFQSLDERARVIEPRDKTGSSSGVVNRDHPQTIGVEVDAFRRSELGDIYDAGQIVFVNGRSDCVGDLRFGLAVSVGCGYFEHDRIVWRGVGCEQRVSTHLIRLLKGRGRPRDLSPDNALVGIHGRYQRNVHSRKYRGTSLDRDHRSVAIPADSRIDITVTIAVTVTTGITDRASAGCESKGRYKETKADRGKYSE